MINQLKRWFKTGFIVLILYIFCSGLLGGAGGTAAQAATRESRLPQGNAITDGRSLLRYALPIDNQAVRDLQASLEDISNQIRAVKRWGAIDRDISKAQRIVSDRHTELVASVRDDQKAEAETLIAQLQDQLMTLQKAAEAKDKLQVRIARTAALDLVGKLEDAMVAKFPFDVPDDYANLPQLKGRATVKFTTSKGDLTVVMDGYSAPITAGNIVDLVQRKFYDGLEFTRAEESYVLQVGDPPGAEVGFIDPKTKKYRAIPLEILVEGDSEPVYGVTLEDLGRYQEHPVLPFSAYGTLALARPSDDPNGGSSQFFFFLFEPELTPAGLNLLDGRYSVFGYLVEGREVLQALRAGDKILSAKVIQGVDKLVQSNVA
jgi:peptidylprolyl isomerase